MKRRSDSESMSSVRTSGETDSGVSVGEMIQRHAVEQQYGATGPGSRDVGVQMKTKYLIQKPRYMSYVRDVGTQTIERGHREMYNPRIISTYSTERLRQNCMDKNYSYIYDRQNYDVYRIKTKSKTSLYTESTSFSDYTQNSNTATLVSETDTYTTIENSYEISRDDAYSVSDVYSVSDDDVNTRTVAVQMSTKYLVEEERPKSIVRDVGVQVRPSPIAAITQQSSPLIDQLWQNKLPLSRNVTCSLPEKLSPCDSISENSSSRSSIYENKKSNSFSSFRMGYRVRRNLSNHSPKEKSKIVNRPSFPHCEQDRVQYVFDHDCSVVQESYVNLQTDDRGTCKRILVEDSPLEEYTSIPIINDRKTNPLVLRGPDDITSGYMSESETSVEVVDSLPPVSVEHRPTPTEKVLTSRYSYAPQEPVKYSVIPEKYHHDKVHVLDMEENNPTVKIGPEPDVVKAEFTESPPPIVPVKHFKPPPAPDVLIRVGGGWMKEEHHRIQHRPLQNKLVPTSDRIPFMRSSFFYNKSKLPVVNKQRKQTDKLRYASFIA